MFVIAFLATVIPLNIVAARELHDVGSGVAFTPVGGLATEGIFSMTRNPLYVGVLFVAMPLLACIFDNAWILIVMAPMWIWLSRVVIPAEESFLTQHYGAAYTAYLESVPRWVI